VAHSERYDDDDDRDDEDGGFFSGGLGPLDTQWQKRLSSASTGGTTPHPGIMRQRPGDPNLEFPPLEPQDSLPEGIELMRTSPLDEPPAPLPQRESALFRQRYLDDQQGDVGQPAPFDPSQRPPSPGEGMSMYARRHAEHHFNVALQQRRAEDERMTGRRWPGNGLQYPGSANEARYFDQLAVALGEVDPRLLARESAMRYVRSAVIPGEDELGSTDIYAILYYGLGLTLRPLNTTGLPHVLAVYIRSTREVYLDWTLLNDPPYGRAALDATVWRRSVDGSVLARFLLAWSVAVHLTDNYDMPLMLGFTPQAPALVASAGHAPTGAPAVPTLPPDTLNRYRKAMVAVATLLAPAERLWQQIAALRLRVHMGDPEWRVHLRAELGYPGGWRPTGGPAPAPAGADPVEQLISVLAERNNCPPMLIEAQLDGTLVQADWNVWSAQLLHQLPQLQTRYSASAHVFRLSNMANAPLWGTPGRPAEPPALVQLSL
jgi:hypothetical protein